jgi:hypothetical protein
MAKVTAIGILRMGKGKSRINYVGVNTYLPTTIQHLIQHLDK